MARYVVINEALGARGVGDFLIGAGATCADIELTDDEALLLAEFDGVTVTESKKPAKAKASE